MTTPSEIMSFARGFSGVRAIIAALLMTGTLGVHAATTDDDAMAILKGMSEYMATQQTMELTFDSAIEVITPQLEKVQFTNSGQALLSRPDKLYAHRIGGYADVALFFIRHRLAALGRGRGTADTVQDGHYQQDAE